MSEFIEMLKSKYPDLDVEKALEIYDKEVATIVAHPGVNIGTISIQSDLAKNVFIHSIGDYLKAHEQARNTNK